MSKKIRAGIFGASGYAGMDLVEILSHHPDVEMVYATSNTYANDPVPYTDLRYIPMDSAKFEGVDVVFLALPHKESAPVAKQALECGVKVLDLSADLRLNTPESYEKWYKVAHPNPELLPVPYGLPEFNRHTIKDSEVVAVPGCYPTTTLLGLYPLLKTGSIEPSSKIIVDAKSGVSGAGRAPKQNTHFVEVFGNLSPYSVGRSHRHVGEIEQEAQKLDPNIGPLVFTPHLLPVDRGLMASIYVNLNISITSERVHTLYKNIYGDEQMVEVLPLEQQATLKHVVRTNKCFISITPVLDNFVHITSVTDNLRKGASGQAVQCMNLMFGLPETTALL